MCVICYLFRCYKTQYIRNHLSAVRVTQTRSMLPENKILQWQPTKFLTNSANVSYFPSSILLAENNTVREKSDYGTSLNKIIKRIHYALNDTKQI